MDAYSHLQRPKGRACLSYQRGLSLIELMIGLLVGLILLGGVLQTMLASKEASSARQSMAVITDNARFLFDFMGRDLRMAGRGVSLPLEHASGSLTAYYTTPAASGTIKVVYKKQGDTIMYSRQIGSASPSSDVLIDGVQNFEVAFGIYSNTGSQITYTAYESAPASMANVVAVRTRVTFADVQAGNFNLNVASTPIVSTVALRNQVAELIK